ncbi:glycine--tRNA ligase subunit beta [Phascolarctobacterium sp. ET69]|uniref:glycine--tRNA ligase subunit beta n=1 Tax=Phascolarctobacterium sp. ET69 TaxID=2939420 RepID=UPI002012FBD2|nr:glycine--tRNA ligase subunit beta [Phascolarctobacterium sp. ET69]MCL1605745.1 glycine--tRNA ligase subunit beta [Phascolarctobacterium sp. ET69]
MEKLLFEIGTEEIPAKFMPGILKQLKELAAAKMQELRIPCEDITVYGTPRRMAFIAGGVAETQADVVVEAKGPSVKIAYVSGAPSKAAQGFARGQGVDVKDLVVRDNYVYAVKHLAGQPVIELLPGLLMDILTSLSFPKTMRWADYEFRFVRPIRWMVALFGDQIIPVEICGVKSGKFSMGHRFMQQSLKAAAESQGLLSAALSKVGNKVYSALAGVKGAVEIPSAGDYKKVMYDNFVMVDQDERRALILQQIKDLAAQNGGEAEINEDLLEEVNYLVEWPTALCGKFEEKFLSLPKECIITPMREHQRYFPVLDEDGNLLNKFITVRNGGSEHLDIVTHGNERVLRARLSDAEFFFNEDRAIKLEDRLEKLKTVSFQEGLGNMYDKSERLVKMAEMLRFAINTPVDEEELRRCALLCKTDLVTGMVIEFTELQGVMGREYALLDGEKPEVATGIFEHYLPRFAGDALPATTIGRIVGIGDKLDNICATFSRGLAPTGSQDPYALRRQALGVINILLDANYHISLAKIIAGTLYLLDIKPEETGKLVPQIMEFFKQRLRNLLMDQGIRYDVIDAVFADKRNDDMVDLAVRCKALAAYVEAGNAEPLVQVSVRVSNLCKKIEKEVAISGALFKDESENKLHEVVAAVSKEIIPEIVLYDYAAVLKAGEKVIEPVNTFFDNVMVMDEDENVKNNRLAMLEEVRGIVNAVGDLSLLVL